MVRIYSDSIVMEKIEKSILSFISHVINCEIEGVEDFNDIFLLQIFVQEVLPELELQKEKEFNWNLLKSWLDSFLQQKKLIMKMEFDTPGIQGLNPSSLLSALLQIIFVYYLFRQQHFLEQLSSIAKEHQETLKSVLGEISNDFNSRSSKENQSHIEKKFLMDKLAQQ